MRRRRNSGVLMETMGGTARSLHAARKRRHKYFNLSPCAQIQQYGALRTVSAQPSFQYSSPPKTRTRAVANKSQKAVPRSAPVPLMRHRTVFHLPSRHGYVCFLIYRVIQMNISKE